MLRRLLGVVGAAAFLVACGGSSDEATGSGAGASAGNGGSANGGGSGGDLGSGGGAMGGAPGSGGNGGAPGSGGSGGINGNGGAPGSGGNAGGSKPTMLACYPLFGQTCPSTADAPGTYMCTPDGMWLVEQWISGPVMQNGQCCYEIAYPSMISCAVIGRPLLIDGVARTAALIDDAALAGHVASDALLSSVARAWADDGLFEHASVASFARFALELLAIGAPLELVADAHRAALDEVRHAELCFSIAAALAGVSDAAPLRAGALPMAAVAASSDLVDVAGRCFVEGCIGETIAALIAHEQLCAAQDASADPTIIAALRTIADDEARHAELAWRTVAWALARGGDAVRRRIEHELTRAPMHVPLVTGIEGAGRYGRLDAARLDAARSAALLEVVLPSALALLGGHIAARSEAQCPEAQCPEAQPLP